MATVSESQALTCQEAAALMGVSSRRVLTEAVRGQIKIAQQGPRVLYDRESVMARAEQIRGERAMLEAELDWESGERIVAVPTALARALFVACNDLHGLVMWVVLERCMSGRTVKTGGGPPTPSYINLFALSRSASINHQRLVQAKRRLIEAGMLIEHPDRKLEPVLDTARWRRFDARPRHVTTPSTHNSPSMPPETAKPGRRVKRA